jgi:thiol-disulfide isomerase/thioredoxin
VRAPNIETADEAAQVEKALEMNPEDLAARDRLLHYYSTRNPVTDAIRLARRRHILWLIEHHPDRWGHNTFVFLIPPPPDPLADPAGEADAVRLWREQGVRPDANAQAISNAVYFLYFHDRKFALQVLEEARQRSPSDAALAGTKGIVNALTITGATAVDTNGYPDRFDTAIADSSGASAAREELRITTSIDQLTSAAESMLKQFRPLFAVRPEFARLLLDLAEGWIQRVVAMKPDDTHLGDRFAMAYLQSSNFVTDEAQKARLFERAAAHARSSEWRVAALQNVIEFHFQSGDVDRARGEAEEMLRKAPEMYQESSRAYAAHIAHTVLGRVALRRDDGVAEARAQLTAAGKLASPDIVGRNGIRWTLASDLLARGQCDVVLGYISMVRAVSSKGKGKLDDWAKSIRAGETPEFAGPTTDPAPRIVGKPAMDFRLRNLDGEQVALSSYKGKLVLLDFWATWCVPCRAELPILEKLHREFAAKDAAIATVDVGENIETVGKYVRGEKYTFPVLLDEDEEMQWQYRLVAFPSLVVIDKQGRVTDLIGGALNEEQLRVALKRARSAN